MLFGLTNPLRALAAASPITRAANEAHRMARRRLEAGGTASPSPKRVGPDAAPTDFFLPVDVDADAVRKAIEAKLRGRGSYQPSDATPVIEKRAGGRVVVPARHLLRLGDGDFARGKQFMHGMISQFRARGVPGKYKQSSR
jgi:hypothetical protein